MNGKETYVQYNKEALLMIYLKNKELYKYIKDYVEGEYKYKEGGLNGKGTIWKGKRREHVRKGEIY